MTEWLERVRGELAGRYRIERELGRGGTATVYLADDLEQQRQVAIKVLHPELVEAVGGQRFLREIRFAASLHHPHLLAVHSWGEASGLLYFVAPYLPDGSLRTRLKRDRQMSVDEATRITREVADALDYVHEHGIVHRDVKPENILFAGKHACVADFGIARAIEIAVGDTLTSTGLVVGTPAYMSPEQASGERAVDARSDQYSLACVLYEMIAGVPPFVGATVQSVISQRFAHAPSPLTFYRPNVPAGVTSAVARALSLAPADRFETVGDFVAALDRAPPAIRTDSAVRLHRVRRRWFVAGAAAAIIVVALVGFDQARSLFGASSSARRAYERGHTAFARGDFESAYRAFSDASTRDTGFAQAHLWRAKTGALTRAEKPSEWRDAARRAVMLSGDLGPREARFGLALLALAEKRYPDACADFEKARPLDSLDFMVWYGLGECQFLDSAVVVSARSRSGWAFRSSFHTATAAYLRSADLDDRMLGQTVYRRLRGTLLWIPRRIRVGSSVQTKARRFAAYAEIAGDTFAFTPYEVIRQVPAEAQPNPENARAALERGKIALLSFVREWVAKDPRNSAALEAYASMLEARGEVADLGGQMSALTAVRLARTLTRDDIKRLQLAATEVRLLIKRYEFGAARALADSLLRAWPRPTQAGAEILHGLAALTGRVRLTARLGALGNQHAEIAGVNVPAPLAESIALLHARAALGVCEGLEPLGSDVLDKVDGYVPAPGAQDVKILVLDLAAMWSAGCPDAGAILFEQADSRSVRAQQALARGRRELARAIADSIRAGRSGLLPGQVSLDFLLHDLWLQAAVGDTAAAIRQLDQVLRSLSVQEATLIDRFSETAALPRAMALRAELASARGDGDTARYWARACLSLWSGADQELRPVVERMKRLAA